MRATFRFPGVLRLCIAALCCLAAQAALGGSAQEIERTYRNGDTAGALARLDQAIDAAPRDLQLRFLKGLLLAESGRRMEAAEVYARLTQEFPELPEPYNNLAVIRAADGRLEEARDALETALRNDPDYTVACENLGDVYARLALRAYQRAAGPGAELQRKLQLARQILGRPARNS